MILDLLDNAAAYNNLGARIAQGLTWLRDTDLASLPLEKVTIDGDNLFAVPQRYDSRTMDKIIWESHRKYIDVQYIAEGSELMGYINLAENPTVTKPFDESIDAALYASDAGSLFRIEAGKFAIFTPQDIHAPGLAIDNKPSPVFKVVVKVLVDGSNPLGF